MYSTHSCFHTASQPPRIILHRGYMCPPLKFIPVAQKPSCKCIFNPEAEREAISRTKPGLLPSSPLPTVAHSPAPHRAYVQRASAPTARICQQLFRPGLVCRSHYGLFYFHRVRWCGVWRAYREGGRFTMR